MAVAKVISVAVLHNLDEDEDDSGDSTFFASILAYACTLYLATDKAIVSHATVCTAQS